MTPPLQHSSRACTLPVCYIPDLRPCIPFPRHPHAVSMTTTSVNGDHEPETDLSARSGNSSPAIQRSYSPAVTAQSVRERLASRRASAAPRSSPPSAVRNNAAASRSVSATARPLMKTLEDFSVQPPSVTSQAPSPTPSESSNPDRPRLQISSLVAQRYARLTKKLDEEEEAERHAAEDRDNKKHVLRSRKSVLSMAPNELAKVSTVEVRSLYLFLLIPCLDRRFLK